MFRDPSSSLIFVARQRRLQEPTAERRRCAPAAERRPTCQWVSPADRAILVRARQVVAAAREVVGAILRWVADLPYDSRERLGSKEQELAALGISWATDSVHDAALAREIEVARQLRRAVGDVAPGGVAAARPDLSPQAARGRRRNSIVRRELNHAGTAVRV
jgi:hypothetical protein